MMIRAAASRRGVAAAALLLTLVSPACFSGGEPLSDAVPVTSIVWIIVDDLGWNDIGVAGSSFYETPHIDRLAAEGTRFSQFDTASPVCSPTRASLMTGKHPARLQLTNWIGGEQSGALLQAEYIRQLPLAEVTPGEAFAEAGYATAYMGKWHLGDGEFLPDAQGFALTVAVNGAGQPATYFSPYHRRRPSVWDVPDLAGGADGEYLTDRLTDEAVAFLRDNAAGPFLLVLSHYAVHTPIESKPELTAKYEARARSLPALADFEAFAPESGLAVTKQRQDNAAYAGMVESTDDSVGRILDTLDELGIADSTAVVLVSDNGGLSTLPAGRTTMPTSNVPLRAGKGWLYEGGIRAPLIIKWPGVSDGRVNDVPVTSMDLFPTLLDMAGLAARPGQHVDGASLAGLLRGAEGLDRDALYWHFPHYHGSGNRPSSAIRVGDMKLVEWLEDGRIELYDLAADPRESTDLSLEEPQLARRLREQLGQWRVDIDARMPAPNPEWTGR